MNHEPREIDRILRLAQRPALDIDQHQVRRRDFTVVQPERIYEERLLRPGHAQADVVEDHLGPAEVIEHA